MSKRSYIALICSLALAALFLITVSSDKEREQETANRTYYTPLDFIVPLPTCSPVTPSPTPTPLPDLDIGVIEDMFIIDYYLELESLGYYYITAYSPLETNCWYTASDTYCHAADYEHRYTEPTTCAVDPSLHHIGEDGDLFYIEEFDTVYIAEDTGGAVKGKHIDICFTDDTLDSVYYFPTGYYEVYSVTVVEYKRLKTLDEI